MIQIEIKRFRSTVLYTLGSIIASDSRGKILLIGYTLELPYRDNRRNISSIPIGIYNGQDYQSPTKGHCILLKDVPRRSYIEIHAGNSLADTEGCILVGDDLQWSKIGSVPYLLNSRKSLSKILKTSEDYTVVIM